MTTFTITFSGPSGLAVRVATELADADGVDLKASAKPVRIDDDTYRLELTVEGPAADVTRAVDTIRQVLPIGASLDAAEH